VEAFSDEITRILRRRHGKGEAIRAVSALIQAGFQNVNVDLMYGLPKQKIEDWVESLTIAADLDVSSITLYPYRIKRGSIWAKLYRSRPDTFRWSPTLEMVLATVGRMYLESRGYRQSAVNWFLKDEACEFRHQDSKYRMQALLGVGCSAYSFFGGSQFFNIYREADYARAIAETDLALEVGRPLTDIEKMTRFFVFGIKGGLQAADFVETFRVSVEEALPSVETLIEKGLVRHSAGRWELTTIGKLFVDEIGLFMHKTTFRMRHVCRARAVQVAG
jgi:oxygen-independent coproporphyrinogen-3 oxidase